MNPKRETRSIQEEPIKPPYYAAEIRRRRKGWHLSQTDLARMTGVSQHTISKIERGQGNPTIETLERLADALRAELVVMVKNPNHTQR